MTVKDLIEQLQKIPPETELWIYVDPEGNTPEVMPLHSSFKSVTSKIVEQQYQISGYYEDKVCSRWIPDDGLEEYEKSKMVLILP